MKRPGVLKPMSSDRTIRNGSVMQDVERSDEQKEDV